MAGAERNEAPVCTGPGGGGKGRAGNGRRAEQMARSANAGSGSEVGHTTEDVADIEGIGAAKVGEWRPVVRPGFLLVLFLFLLLPATVLSVGLVGGSTSGRSWKAVGKRYRRVG